jgi:rare lipoprotein A
VIKVLLFIVIAAHCMSGGSTHYGHGLDHGHFGASGIYVNSNDPVAAHRSLPFGTIVRVINADPKSKNYKESTLVIIFDRGPVRKSACIDLMAHTMWDLAGKKCGGIKVRLEVVNTRYQCNSYKCLSKKLGVKRITDEKLLEMINK